MSSLLVSYNVCNQVVCTDSRAITPGCLFFCLKGDTFDGHDFVDEVIAKGAGAVVVSDSQFADTEKCICVPDTLKALQDLATEYRAQFTIPVIAIGGSNGKTTTKELIRVSLETKYKVHATKTNLNNHIGVPLTLLSMPADTEIAVIEIGANHMHEHEVLLDIVQPTHVLITNNGKDHLEGFGSMEGVRTANGEIFVYAKNHNLTAFVSDFETDLLEMGKDMQKIIYGYEKTSHYVFTSVSTMLAAVQIKEQKLESNLFGDFNEKNIMTAATVALYFKCDLGSVATSINTYQPGLLRSQIKEIDGVRYIIDCYNANPSSMAEALKNFKKYCPTPNAIVLGDMLEMGNFAYDEHVAVAELVLGYDFTLNIFVGKNFGDIKEKYVDKHNFYFFDVVGEAKEFLATQDLKGWSVLLKGSNGVKIKEILN